MRKWVVLTLGIAASTFAADWLTDGGGPSRDNWQKREITLAPGNVKGLKLLWKQKLGDSVLSAPVILGPIVTQRGIKELVLVESAANEIFAIDADLGRTFWTTRLDSTAPPCASAPATPAITPEEFDTEEDGEAHTPRRPVYFAASDGLVHKVSPSTGMDLAAPRKSLGGCGEAIKMASFVPLGTASFVWKRRKISVGGEDAAVKLPGPVATWEAEGGTRWIYSADAGGLRAWTFEGALKRKWSAPGLGGPVIANGMVFALGEGKLNVLDAVSGQPLFSTAAETASSKLALANGHICFTSASTLYCFGLPFEIY